MKCTRSEKYQDRLGKYVIKSHFCDYYIVHYNLMDLVKCDKDTYMYGHQLDQLSLGLFKSTHLKSLKMATATLVWS